MSKLIKARVAELYEENKAAKKKKYIALMDEAFALSDEMMALVPEDKKREFDNLFDKYAGVMDQACMISEYEAYVCGLGDGLEFNNAFDKE